MSKFQDRIIAIKRNNIVRLFYMPVFYIKQCILLLLYQFSEDSRYVRSLYHKHENERCFIIGNGPSLTVADLDYIKGEITFGSNRIYRMYDKTNWRPNYYLCTDPRIGKEIKSEIRAMEGSIRFLANSMSKKKDRRFGIHHIVQEPRYGGIRPERFVQKKFTTKIHRCVSKTHTVTCTAIEMAVYMGIKEIYLLGIDHTFAVEIQKDGTKVFHAGIKNHFEGGESSLKAIESTTINIEASTQCYQVCQDYALAHGIKIYNCTRGGKLEVFERKALEDVIGERGV